MIDDGSRHIGPSWRCAAPRTTAAHHQHTAANRTASPHRPLDSMPSTLSKKEALILVSRLKENVPHRSAMDENSVAHCADILGEVNEALLPSNYNM
jgi:hypothetical protein